MTEHEPDAFTGSLDGSIIIKGGAIAGGIAGVANDDGMFGFETPTIRKFFNTSGQMYRSMGLSKKLPDMSEDEMFKLLASDGMLVKRPLLVTEDRVLTGFKEGLDE